MIAAQRHKEDECEKRRPHSTMTVRKCAFNSSGDTNSRQGRTVTLTIFGGVTGRLIAPSSPIVVGTLASASQWIGVDGSGTFAQTGGSNTLSTNLVIARWVE